MTLTRDHYNAYLAVFGMRLPLPTRRHMLAWISSETPDHCRVVGITVAALEHIAQREFAPEIRKDIRRAHLVDRKDWLGDMLGRKYSFDEWLAAYADNDSTVLATKVENATGRRIESYISFDNPEGLFRQQGFGWKFRREERELLRQLYEEQRGGALAPDHRIDRAGAVAVSSSNRDHSATNIVGRNRERRVEVAKSKLICAPGSRSDAVAITWDDPNVRSARMTKHGCELDGAYYNSTWAAWQSTDYHHEIVRQASESTSMSRCISFRQRLKAAGELIEHGHHWKIVPRR